MLPMDTVVRKQAQDICQKLLSEGFGRDEIGVALAQCIGTLLLPLQENSTESAASLMDAIRSHAALQLSRRAIANAIFGRRQKTPPAMPPLDEDQVFDAFPAFQCFVEGLVAEETEEELLDYGKLAETLIDILIDLELAWMTAAKLSWIVTRSRATDESIADGDEELFSEANNRLN